MSPDQRGNGSLRHDYGIPVDVISLNIYCNSRNVGRVDFIKIDVEGMEIEVLKGAQELLRLFKPVLFFETLEELNRDRGVGIFDEIGECLSNLGYNFFTVRNVSITLRHLHQ